jgi:hypothetical protein
VHNAIGENCWMKYKNTYSWKRFWFRRDKQIKLTDKGYLFDPDEQYGNLFSRDALSFDEINNSPCLVLLGEPGIGKSVSLRVEQESVESKIKESGDRTLFIDLRSFRSEDRLIRKLFENDIFVSWVKGDHRLYLFLDSLDECLLQIKTLASILSAELQGYPVDRLYLRIACRTAEWPHSLEESLKDLWGENAVSFCQLAPLRKKDVLEAAKVRGVNPASFLEEIEHKRMEPLAIKPVTLEFLINTYSKTGGLPVTQTDLYRKGVRLLCEEVSPERRGAGFKGNHGVEQKIAVAARIAALTIFSNRYAISTGVDLGNIPEEDLTIEDIQGGFEYVGDQKINIGEDLVRETLSTGLFLSRGPERLGWAHQTFAEFLAAHFVSTHDMSSEQIMNLLSHSDDPDGRLVPQLYETAAWVASMSPIILRNIIQQDPKALFRSGVLVGSDSETRSRLVDNLLLQYDNGTLKNDYLESDEDYKYLIHPGLYDQLRLYTTDNAKSVDARYEAIEIGVTCSVKGLMDDLINIIVDTQQTHSLRKRASYSICRMNDDNNSNLEKLKPFIYGNRENDPNDEIRGNVFKVLWPKFLTTEELFAALDRPGIGYLGSYYIFIYELADYLWKDDIQTALKWVIKKYQDDYSLSRLIEAVLKQGYENLNVPGVCELLAEALLVGIGPLYKSINLREYDRDEATWLVEDEKRRKILKAMVPLLQKKRVNTVRVLWGDPQIVFKKDIYWMLKCLKETGALEEKKVWADLIREIWDCDDGKQLNIVIETSHQEPVLSETLGLNPIEIDSPEAQKIRTNYLQMQELRKDARRHPDSKVLRAEEISGKILKELDKFESGDLYAWIRIVKFLKTASGELSTIILDPDLTNFPGLDKFDEAMQSRIIKTAEVFIQKFCLQIDWMEMRSSITTAEICSVIAFLLLLAKSKDSLLSFSKEKWEKWHYLILDSSFWTGSEALKQLQKIAYEGAPKHFGNVLLKLLERDIKNGRNRTVVENLKSCLDEQLIEVITPKIDANLVKPDAWGGLFEAFLKFNSKKANIEAKKLLSPPIPKDGEGRKRAIITAEKLLTNSEDAGWLVIWPLIQEDTSFGKEVIEAAADHSNHGEFEVIVGKLSDEQITDFYIWMETQYPQSEDPEDVDGIITARFTISRWKNKILNTLVERGSHSACEGIRKIMRTFPVREGLEYVLYEAKQNARKQTWIPYRAQEILKLSEHRQNRLVQNSEQLLEILLESLKRIEESLNGETPTARFIWDYNNDTKKYRPIDENSFSDYLKVNLDRELNQNGVIINREVQIHRGERTDLHINAVMKGQNDDSYEKATVIIEVKGCWHPELKQAMKKQLADRYLGNNQCRHGIYLVGWFYCDRWGDDDSRKKKTPNMDKDEAESFFDKQAAELSQKGLTIKSFVMDTSLAD